MFEVLRNEDIIKLANRVDAIVNAANSELLRGGGICGAIFRGAGPQLDKECAEIGGCRTGNAVITKAYNLPCKYIVHAVGPIWGQTGKERELANAYINAIDAAYKAGCKSVCFPLISSGIYGCPKDIAEDVAINAINKALQRYGEEMDVYLIIRD